MRGTRNLGLITGALSGRFVRFIPAHAGNTIQAAYAKSKTAVHPRACGEHGGLERRREFDFGSSPRMRGTRNSSRALQRSRRFIPAHAGNTCLICFVRFSSSVHPRACGEHPMALPAATERHGSSPRMRGTRHFLAHVHARPRFIPAHAGNTHLRLLLVSSMAVHPRACGEHGRKQLLVFAQHGSSPRMRGTRPVTRLPRLIERFIPAHAGNTLLKQAESGIDPVHPRACGEHHTSR